MLKYYFHGRRQNMDTNKNSLKDVFAKMSEEDLLAIKEYWGKEKPLAKQLFPDSDIPEFRKKITGIEIPRVEIPGNLISNKDRGDSGYLNNNQDNNEKIPKIQKVDLHFSHHPEIKQALVDIGAIAIED
jgi:hypothetical protein